MCTELGKSLEVLVCFLAFMYYYFRVGIGNPQPIGCWIEIPAILGCYASLSLSVMFVVF